ncbi:MAG: DUF5678 domain-containing protein [Nanoarchaeota archaeon]
MSEVNQILGLLNESETDIKWLQDNYEDLKNRYDNKFIAIRKGQILAADSNVHKVLEKIKAKKENPAKAIIQFISKIPIIF